MEEARDWQRGCVQGWEELWPSLLVNSRLDSEASLAGNRAQQCSTIFPLAILESRSSPLGNVVIPIPGSPKVSSQFGIRLRVPDLMFQHQVWLGMRILGSNSSGTVLLEPEACKWKRPVNCPVFPAARIITIDASIPDGEQAAQSNQRTCLKLLDSRQETCLGQLPGSVPTCPMPSEFKFI